MSLTRVSVIQNTTLIQLRLIARFKCVRLSNLSMIGTENLHFYYTIITPTDISALVVCLVPNHQRRKCEVWWTRVAQYYYYYLYYCSVTP